jgi:hypothetical protein
LSYVTEKFKKTGLTERLLIFASSVGLFGYLTSFTILDPSNFSWLSWSDHGHQFYAWESFRHADLLQWPITRNPQYAIGFENFIGFPTGFATMALIAKPFLFWSKTPIQYFGIGILLLFVLQGQMALRLLKNFNLSRSSQLFGSVVFLLSPLFLHRFSFGTTLAMVATSHFLILFAFDTYFRNDSGFLSWTGVLVLSAIIEPYILAMNLTIFFFWSINGLFESQLNQTSQFRLKRLIKFIATCIVPFIFLYVLGAIGFVSTRSQFGFGLFRADLMAVLNSSLNFPDIGTDPIRWSDILPSRDLQVGLAEGFGYVGVISLLGLSMFFGQIVFGRRSLALFESIKRKHWFLLLAVLLMAVHASAGIFSFGGSTLFQLDYPSKLDSVNQSFRATGRFVWPLAYFLTLFAVIVLTATIQKIPKKTRFLVFLCLVVLQVGDQKSGFDALRMQFTEPENVRSTVLSNRLISPEWEGVTAGAAHIQVVLPLSNSPIWEDVLALAFRSKATTNAGVLARVNEKQVRDHVVATIREMRRPILQCDRVYFVPLDEVSRSRLRVLYSRFDLNNFLREQRMIEGRNLRLLDNVQIISC